jgi:hypothetical protein
MTTRNQQINNENMKRYMLIIVAIPVVDVLVAVAGIVLKKCTLLFHTAT